MHSTAQHIQQTKKQNTLECARTYTHTCIIYNIRARALSRAHLVMLPNNEPRDQSRAIKSSLFSRWFNTIFVYNFIIIIFPSLLWCVLFSFTDSGFFFRLEAQRKRTTTKQKRAMMKLNVKQKNNLLTAGSYSFGLIIDAWNGIAPCALNSTVRFWYNIASK